MKRIVIGALLAGVAVLQVSCLDGNDDPVSTAQATANVTGAWAGATFGGEPVAMDLNQTLTAVSGTARFGSLDGDVSGIIDGNRFEGAMATRPPRVIFASVSGSTMSGTFRDATGKILDNFDARLR
jgi:hypothetical protein